MEIANNFRRAVDYVRTHGGIIHLVQSRVQAEHLLDPVSTPSLPSHALKKEATGAFTAASSVSSTVVTSGAPTKRTFDAASFEVASGATSKKAKTSTQSRPGPGSGPGLDDVAEEDKKRVVNIKIWPGLVSMIFPDGD